MSVKRPALGRGLTSLMTQLADDAPHREVPVGALMPNRLQPRTVFDEEALNDLTASILANGLLQPLVVRPMGDRYEIIVGERRWRAVQRAGMAMVPVIVKEIPDERLLELALVENIQRAELNPIEEARAYWQLGEMLRLTQEQVADRVGKSRSQVTNTLRLLRLTTSIQELIASGKLSLGHAKVLLGLEDSRIQEQLAQEVIDRQLSVRALEQRVLQLSSKKRPRRSQPSSIFTKAAAEELTQQWSTRVEIKSRGKAGTILMHYGSEGELDRLFEALRKGPVEGKH